MSGAIVKAVTSGQTMRMPRAWNSRNNVYITKDNKYIVVDGISFKIYSPEPKQELNFIVPEKWYDVDSWECEKMEFDAGKAALGIVLALVDLDDDDFAEGHDGYPTTKKGTKIFKERNSILLGTKVVKNVLQAIADEIEYTYVKFNFQVSDLKNYRVMIFGGTKSDTYKYINYQGYDYRRSFLSDIVTDIFYIDTKEDLKEVVSEALERLIIAIKKKESFSKLLVTEEELSLKDNEYYDIELYLNSERRFNNHQVCIYTDEDGNVSQKFITYPKEGLYLVKRRPMVAFDLFSKKIDLVNMIDDLIIKSINLDFNNTFWQLCEQVLKDYNDKTMSLPIADPSNAMKMPMSELCRIVWEENQKK